MTKQSVWAVRHGEGVTITTPAGRHFSLIRGGETAHDVVHRLGFQVIGGFTASADCPGRSTAKVVAR